jgi:hypothetical protein
VGKIWWLALLEDGQVVIAVLEDNETVNLKSALLKKQSLPLVSVDYFGLYCLIPCFMYLI